MKRLLLLTFCFLAAGSPLPAADKPNILFIMSDDHAAHALGAYGGRLAALPPRPRSTASPRKA